MAIKKQYQYIGYGLAALLVVGGLKLGMNSGVIPTPSLFKSKVPEKSESLAGNVAVSKPTQVYELAASPVGAPSAPVSIESISWNGTAPTTFANGGPTTTPDSLIAKYTGATVNISAQDNYDNMKTNLIKFATGVSKGESAPQGSAFVQIMGDGYPAFVSTLQKAMPKGQEVEVVYVTGFSYGEDKCMGPAAAKQGKDGAKGLLIAAVPYDGDWNICVKWASDNEIAINTDQKTFDPNAINFVDTTSFQEADEKYITGASETRDEIVNGKKTGKKVTVKVNGVATWTPGDVAVAKQKGGLVTLASTKDYNQQMPAVLIGNKQWMAEHKAFVVNLIKALDRSAFAIRNGDTGFGKTQAAVYGTAGGPPSTAEFWIKYYNGYNDTDATGMPISLGGSRAVTAAEVKTYFGLTPGSSNKYKTVYDVFGGYARDYYPDAVPEIIPYEKVVNTEYLLAALEGVNVGAAKSEFETKQAITQAVSTKAYAIQFTTGTATITPASVRLLTSIQESAAIAGGLRIQISGHTDDTGSVATNTALSKARAQAVADWLSSRYPNDFPANRMEVIGYGSDMPKASNDTEAGRAQNRRVEILLGK
jgi:outer membrane protein OmpA-like peptidoglycan-associated protein